MYLCCSINDHHWFSLLIHSRRMWSVVGFSWKYFPKWKPHKTLLLEVINLQAKYLYLQGFNMTIDKRSPWQFLSLFPLNEKAFCLMGDLVSKFFFQFLILVLLPSSLVQLFLNRAEHNNVGGKGQSCFIFLRLISRLLSLDSDSSFSIASIARSLDSLAGDREQICFSVVECFDHFLTTNKFIKKKLLFERY